MRLLRRSIQIASATLIAACGGGGGGGGTTNPPPPPPPSGQTLGSITTSVPSLALNAGQTSTISVTARDTQGAAMTGFSPVFTTESATIAEVSAQGVVLAISAGSTQINVSVTVGSVAKTASVAVAVTGSLPSSMTVVANADAVYPAFTPDKIVLRAGGTVTWQFGSLEHTVSFSGGGGAPPSIPNSYSTSVARTFSTRGDFNYGCTIHSGMSGQVVVR